MKKQYIAPTIMVQSIAFARIMTSSIVVNAQERGDAALSNGFFSPNLKESTEFPWYNKDNDEQSALTDRNPIIAADVPAQYIGGISVIVVRRASSRYPRSSFKPAGIAIVMNNTRNTLKNFTNNLFPNKNFVSSQRKH